MSYKFNIGIYGADPDLARICAESLRDLADIAQTAADLASSGSECPDLLLCVLGSPPEEVLGWLGQVRGRYEHLAVIVLGSTLSVDEAVELVKCGIQDYLSLPPNLPALQRKVERALFGRMRPAFDSPLFQALMAPPRSPEVAQKSGINRRHCFRALVPQHLQTQVYLVHPAGQAVGLLEDLSIVTEGYGGGLLVRLDAAAAAGLPVKYVKLHSEIRLGLRLPGETRPIEVRARVVRLGLPEGVGPMRVAVQYIPPEPRLNEKLQAFWLQCQRTVRAEH